MDETKITFIGDEVPASLHWALWFSEWRWRGPPPSWAELHLLEPEDRKPHNIRHQERKWQNERKTERERADKAQRCHEGACKQLYIWHHQHLARYSNYLHSLLHCVTLITCAFHLKPASIASWHGVSLASFVLHLKSFSFKWVREREKLREFSTKCRTGRIIKIKRRAKHALPDKHLEKQSQTQHSTSERRNTDYKEDESKDHLHFLYPAN